MTAIDTATSTSHPSYRADLERLERARSADPQWLRALRIDAFDRFAALGFPTTRHEEWRFTNVAPIAEGRFVLAAGDAPLDVAEFGAYSFSTAGLDEVVVVDGRFAPALSRVGHVPRGAVIGGLGHALQGDPSRVEQHLARHARVDGQPFTALNTAFLTDGAFIDLGPNVVLERPVHVLFVTTGAGAGEPRVSHPRLLVALGRNSQMRLVESYVTLSPVHTSRPQSLFTNAVTEIVLGDGAVADHYRLQREARTLFHVATSQVRLGHSSSYSSHAFTFGGALVRHDVNAVLDDEGGDCTLNGLYLADGARLVDTHTFIDHAKPHCNSHEIYKGILGGRARAVFNGKILVRPDAQKTDAKQTNKTLLLSDDAQINTKPQLEIYANDVRCTHGATVGQLSADALFYLQARGIGRDEARRMLIRAFAADLTSRVRIDPVRDVLDRLLADAMEGR